MIPTKIRKAEPIAEARLRRAQTIKYDWQACRAETNAWANLTLNKAFSLRVEPWLVPTAGTHWLGWLFAGEQDMVDTGMQTKPAEREERDSSTVSELHPGSEARRALWLRLSAVLQPPSFFLLSTNSTLEWHKPLLRFQREGVAALLANRQLLLADDMGLGKTAQAIAALRLLFFQRKITHALVVAPASLLRQWAREFAVWAPELSVLMMTAPASERAQWWKIVADVRLISYETLREDVLNLRDSPALRVRWDVVILDEASKIKNRETDTAYACKRLPRDRRWALTGTPLENRLEEVISILEFLNAEPGQRLFIPSEPRAIVSELKQVQLRRKKEDVLPDLPPRWINELVLELPEEQYKAYKRLERQGIARLRSTGQAISVTHVLELIMRLKQICNIDPVSQRSAKMEDIRQRLEILSEEGHRALLFTQFTDPVFGVEGAVQFLKAFHPLPFTGAMTQTQRASVIDRFVQEPKHKVLILSLRAGGMGLNLQSASYVFHWDRWWNPAIEEQADSRAHRMGQAHPVTIFRYVCLNTIEERIDRILREKRQLFLETVDDVSLNLSAALTEAELFGLFNLTPTKR